MGMGMGMRTKKTTFIGIKIPKQIKLSCKLKT